VHTNQSADPGLLYLPELACQHAPGEGTAQTCTYLRTVERVREWAERAEQTHRAGQSRRYDLGELWLLFAEVQGAHDACPDHVALVETHREAH
jgi:hypothetical protein